MHVYDRSTKKTSTQKWPPFIYSTVQYSTHTSKTKNIIYTHIPTPWNPYTHFFTGHIIQLTKIYTYNYLRIVKFESCTQTFLQKQTESKVKQHDNYTIKNRDCVACKILMLIEAQLQQILSVISTRTERSVAGECCMMMIMLSYGLILFFCRSDTMTMFSKIYTT